MRGRRINDTSLLLQASTPRIFQTANLPVSGLGPRMLNPCEQFGRAVLFWNTFQEHLPGTPGRHTARRILVLIFVLNLASHWHIFRGGHPGFDTSCHQFHGFHALSTHGTTVSATFGDPVPNLRYELQTSLSFEVVLWSQAPMKCH
jgi:hypothetical protein